MIKIVPKIGTGTHEDPYRPDINAIPEVAMINKRLNAYRLLGAEIKDICFYIVKVLNDLGAEFKIEVTDLVDLYSIYASPPMVNLDPDIANWGAEERGIQWYNTTENKLKMWTGTSIVLLS